MNLSSEVWLGSQYYINDEETPEQIYTVIAAMHNAGLKLVRIFLQWHQVERYPGQWNWAQYDALFEAAAQYNMGVVVTFMAVHPPGWMLISHSPQEIGPLENQAFWQQAKEYVQQVVLRYGLHRSLHSWILWNEPGRLVPHNQDTLILYQAYLREYSQNDLSFLNKAFYQQISSFEEVTFPTHTNTFSSYGEQLAWMRFSIWLLNKYLGELHDLIRNMGNKHPIHLNPDNLAGTDALIGQSVWKQGRLVDFLGCSAHPSWHSTRFKPEQIVQSLEFFANLTRSASQAQANYFWVSELQGGTNIFSGLKYLCPEPEELALWVWACIGAGAKAIVFWCFNARSSGFEGGEWSLLNQLGQPSNRLKAVTKVARLLERHSLLFASAKLPKARVAILYSEASWQLGQLEGNGTTPTNPRNEKMSADALVGAYLACTDLGLGVDFVDEVDLQAGKAAPYSALLLPGCTVLETASLTALKTYLESGGQLIADGLCGYKDENGVVRSVQDQTLNKIFGAVVEDIEAVAETNNQFVEINSHKLPLWFLKVRLLADSNTHILANFDSDSAALTFAKVGKGCSLRIGTVFFQRYFSQSDPTTKALLAEWLSLNPSFNSLAGAELARLRNPCATLRLRRMILPEEKSELIFLFNQAASAKCVVLETNSETVLFQLTEHDLVAVPQDQEGIYNVEMGPYSTTIFKIYGS